MSRKKKTDQIINPSDPTKKEMPKLVARMFIDIFSDGGCRVGNFPSNYHTAMQWFDVARKRLVDHFMQAAREGKIDDKGNMEQKTIISASRTKIVGPDGKLLQ